MYSAILSQWLDISNRAIVPMLRLNQIALNAIGRAAQRQVDVAEDCMELSLRQTKLLVEVRDRPQFFADEWILAGEIGNRFVAHTEEFVQIARETQQAMSGFFESSDQRVPAESMLKGQIPHAA